MSSRAKQPSAAGRVQVQLPANLDPVYANLAMITHSPSEVVIDFAQLMPQVPRAKVKARVVITPVNAKLLLRALGENLSRFEAQYGEIQVPKKRPTLADELFGPPLSGPQKGE
jgi:hypothetical protein